MALLSGHLAFEIDGKQASTCGSHQTGGARALGQGLEQVTSLGQSALPQHLARLRKDRLVTTRKSAQTVFYPLADHEVREVMETLDDLCEREFETPLS